MKVDAKDPAFLWDIKTAAGDILDFTKDIIYNDFENSKMIRYSVERQLLVIGEAAKRVSRQTRDLAADIPWEKIIGLRNILAHEYGEILTERIWIVARNNVPELYAKIDKLLKEIDKEID
jgi:uncharacterized protein with HEPN domain